MQITGRTLFTAIGEVLYPAVEVDEAGRISEVSSDPTLPSQDLLTPTFFDVHTHGAAGEDVMTASDEGFRRIGRFLPRHGTSHYLPTTVTAAVDRTLSALERIADRIRLPTPPDEATPVGIHLEGPFLSPARRGVHPLDDLQPPSPALFDRFQEAAQGAIVLMTVAPELPGALDLIRHATGQGVRVSLGHTDATAEETLAAIAAGAVSATHTFNAMRPFSHRDPGVLAAVLTAPTLFAELICDGIHVAPTAVAVWWKLKREHAILVTDSMSATGMPDGNYMLGPLPVTVCAPRCTLVSAPETLAGSVLTLDHAVGNLCRYSGCTLAEAVRAASAQPARMLGLETSVASIRPGQPANLNRFSPGGQLLGTWLNGQAVEPA